MFRNDKQKCQAIRALLRIIDKQHLWGEYGPYPEAYTAPSEPFNLSKGEVTLLNVCLDIWNPSNRRATLGDLLGTLDGRLTRAVTRLLTASVDGPDAVDQWIKDRDASVSAG